MTPLKDRMPIADMQVKDLIDRIGGNAVTPGSGSAGAVALALAAACAAKAVSITLKHRPAEPQLRLALTLLTRIAHLALSDADRDSDAFEEFIRARTAAAAARLVSEGENFSRLIAELVDAVEGIESGIESSMRGDLAAAKALIGAARSIQEGNDAEAPRS
jgi:hypothetical protein